MCVCVAIETPLAYIFTTYKDEGVSVCRDISAACFYSLYLQQHQSFTFMKPKHLQILGRIGAFLKSPFTDFRLCPHAQGYFKKILPG